MEKGIRIIEKNSECTVKVDDNSPTKLKKSKIPFTTRTLWSTWRNDTHFEWYIYRFCSHQQLAYLLGRAAKYIKNIDLYWNFMELTQFFIFSCFANWSFCLLWYGKRILCWFFFFSNRHSLLLEKKVRKGNWQNSYQNKDRFILSLLHVMYHQWTCIREPILKNGSRGCRG